ncbi:hypothetical protein [Mycolicibacterium arseniciresistens]|uniref:Uncharacterized protein n=1 Tax=Mycolicibacterium arseniciresistens TaxID=3062257 RepID=A0ABT8UNF3_9MYCO|nr:hypothetical protein [Mycolicibacterium arseniciresistens]MDO3639334.1 hypothetical protein [Mycolicibacterium arseniciresistens]
MPSLDGALSLRGHLIPADNLARIIVTDNSLNVSWTWTIRGGRTSENRWKTLGIPPVVWYWLPPTGLPGRGPSSFIDPGDGPTFREPVLLIALARDATVEPKLMRQFTKFYVQRQAFGGQKRGMEQVLAPDPTSLHSGTVWCDLTPKVTVFRIQDPEAMPSFDNPQSIIAAMGAPYALVSGNESPVPLESTDIRSIKDRLAAQLGYVWNSVLPPTLLIVPQPTSVVIQHREGHFQVQVAIKDPDERRFKYGANEPAAYAYSAACQGSTSLIIIHHDDNVTVTVQSGPGAVARSTFIYSRLLPHDEVPPQGAYLALDPQTDHRHELPDPTSFKSVLQLMIEVPLSFVPIVGDLYEFGQLAYMAATGRDFWGNPVSTNEILVYGALAALTVGATAYARMTSRSAQLGKELARIEQLSTDLRRMVDDADSSIQQGALLKQIKELPAPQQEKLVKMLETSMKNPRAAAALAENIQHAVHDTKAARKDVEKVADLDVKALLTEDMSSFANDMLRWEYNDYFKRWARLKDKRLAPLDWLLLTDRQWVVAYLRAHLGDDFRTVIKAAYGRLPSQATLTRPMLIFYDTMQIKLGINNYGVMQRRVQKFAGFGYFFELDHIIEQRFIRRLRAWTESVPEYLAFQTFLVPKNAGVAAEMIRIDRASHAIRYVHTAKTDIMRTLIPHGSEKLFNVQQIADATLFALKSLDADKYMIKIEVLEEDFRFLAQAMNQKMPVLRPWAQLTEDLFTAAKGWPQVK